MEPFLGQIILFAGNFAPRGWALCDGQTLSISQYTALFSILGTTYGGDGRTTFQLPDLRSRVPAHAGTGAGLPPVSLGEKAGNATTTLNTNNMPSHTHIATVTNQLRVSATTASGNQDDPDGHYLAGGTNIYHAGPPDVQLNAGVVGGSLSVTNSHTGNGVAFSNMQPFLGLNFIIALSGTFPSRN